MHTHQCKQRAFDGCVVGWLLMASTRWEVTSIPSIKRHVAVHYCQDRFAESSLFEWSAFLFHSSCIHLECDSIWFNIFNICSDILPCTTLLMIIIEWICMCRAYLVILWFIAPSNLITNANSFKWLEWMLRQFPIATHKFPLFILFRSEMEISQSSMVGYDWHFQLLSTEN